MEMPAESTPARAATQDPSGNFGRIALLALSGLLIGFFDAFLLRTFGLSFAVNDHDATWMVGAYFGLSFAALGWLVGSLWQARDRERAANQLIRRQTEALETTRRRLAHTDKLASLGQLAAAVAHEVRNPLGVIRSAAQSVTEANDHEEARRAATFIVSEADRLNAVVGTVLAFAKPLPLQRRPAGVAQIVERAAALVARELDTKGLRLDAFVSDALPPVEVDPDLITQALLGLLHNAIEATAAGGRIGVAVQPEGDALLFEVSDNGPGVPEAVRARIFEPFFTTRANGTGLGLAVVRQIIEAHAGSLAVGSAAGGGARFTLRLPRPAAMVPA